MPRAPQRGKLGRLRRAPARHDALDSGEIAMRREIDEPRRGRQRLHRIGLAGADFDKEPARRRKQPGDLRRQRAVGVEPVGAAVEREPRVVLPDLARQAGDVAAGNVGRIGDDQIEGPFEALGPVGDANLDPRDEAERLEIGVRLRRRAGAEIDADAARGGKFAQQRREQRARADAEIDDAQGFAAARGEGGERRFDDRFRFRARVERFRRQGEGQAPELASADDARQRLAGGAPRRVALRRRPRPRRAARQVRRSGRSA